MRTSKINPINMNNTNILANENMKDDVGFHYQT